MNNELLLEWCILNNPGVKQDIFPDNTDTDDKFTTWDDFYKYGLKDYVGDSSIARSEITDYDYETNLKKTVEKQYNTDDGMKANDLKFGSDWINPRLAKTFFELYYDETDTNHEHAKKFLKYAWLQGKLDSSKKDTNSDKSKEVKKSNELGKNSKTEIYNITTYIKELDLNTLKANTGNSNFDQKYLDDFKAKYIDPVKGTQKFTAVQKDNNGKTIPLRDKDGKPIKSKKLVEQFLYIINLC